MKIAIPPEKVRSWVESRFDFKERKDGNQIVICNPFDGDTGYNFNICPDILTCHDWRGNNWQGFDAKGKLNKCTFLNFVRIYLKCTFREAVKSVLGENSRFFLPRKPIEETTPDQIEATIDLPSGSVPIISSPYPKQATMLLKWLASRGVQADDVERYNLHHCGSDVIWPYYEYEVLVYWQSRSRLNKRFLFPPLEKGGKGKGDFLYGFDDVEPANHLVLTEAIFDKYALRSQTLATGGAILTKAQLGLIRALGPRDGVVLAPDNDKAGVNSVASNGAMLLSCGHKVYYSIPPKLEYESEGEKKITKDWSELGQHVVGWKEVPALMEKGIEKLDQMALVQLRMNTS